MTTDENKLQILRKVESGTLSIEEGADLLSILDRAESEPVPEETKTDEPMNLSIETIAAEVPAGWRALWSIFIWLGVIFMGASGYWLYSSYARSGMGWGFWFAFIFLFLSAAIVFFGWRLVAGRWLVARVNSKENGEVKRYKFWAPLPIHMGIWAFKTFGKYMPEDVLDKHYDQFLVELDNSLSEDEVFVVDLDGDDQHKTHINLKFEA
jgi:hypothetical protein